MQYKIVSVYFDGEKLNSYFSRLPYNRKKIKTKPHKGGWYYYPETMSDEEALGILKCKLIEEIDQEIARLSKIRKLLIENEKEY